MTSWYYMVLVSIPLFLFLIWKEWKRNNKARLFQRLLASLLAVTAIFCMAYSYKTTSSKRPGGPVVLLTDGFVHDSLTHFLQQQAGLIPLFSTDPTVVHASRDLSVQWMDGLNTITEKYGEDTLHVFGNGFTQQELDMLRDHTIIFHASPVVSSIVSVYWKQQVTTGESLVVQGQYENASAGNIKILLRAFNETVDSAEVPANANQDFSLITIPKQRGGAIYSLTVIAGHDTLQREPVPFEVVRATPLKLLFLSSSPGFENTFLKNYLSREGYSITIRTTISKNKSDRQFLNMPEQAGDSLTESFLNKFDVLVTDEDALSEISAAGLAAVRSAMENNGLGLMVTINSRQNKPQFYSHLFPVYLLRTGKKKSFFIYPAGNDSIQYKIRVDEPACLRYQPGTQVLLQDEQSEIFASAALYGSGRIVAVTLNNTFSLALSGNPQAYQSLWTLLLQKAAKKIVPEEIWCLRPFLSLVNEPVTVQVATPGPRIPQAQAGRSNIYFKQHSLFPWQWVGVYWPDSSGWQSMVSSTGKITNWYVFKNSDWKNLFNSQKLTETKKYAALHPLSYRQRKPGGTGLISSYRSLIFLLLFLIGCSYLWIEQKSMKVVNPLEKKD